MTDEEKLVKMAEAIAAQKKLTFDEVTSLGVGSAGSHTHSFSGPVRLVKDTYLMVGEEAPEKPAKKVMPEWMRKAFNG